MYIHYNEKSLWLMKTEYREYLAFSLLLARDNPLEIVGEIHATEKSSLP